MFQIVLDVPDNGSQNHEISYLFGQSTGSYATWITSQTIHMDSMQAPIILPCCTRSKTILYVTPNRIERNTVFA